MRTPQPAAARAVFSGWVNARVERSQMARLTPRSSTVLARADVTGALKYGGQRDLGVTVTAYSPPVGGMGARVNGTGERRPSVRLRAGTTPATALHESNSRVGESHMQARGAVYPRAVAWAAWAGR